MAEVVELTTEQSDLRAQVESALNRVRGMMTLGGMPKEKEAEFYAAYGEMARKAHQLHMSLKATGYEPRHSKHMVENRELPADHPDFYDHVHPVEDLLKFIDDPSANDDPEDVTIGEEFMVEIYTRRWGHTDAYHITRTADGWDIGAGACDKGGKPHLYDKLRHDSVDYPEDLPNWLEFLWENAAAHGLSKEEVQAYLGQIAAWISLVEKSGPSGGIWNGYKRG